MRNLKERVVHIGVHPYNPEDPTEYMLKVDERLKDPDLDQILLIERDMYHATASRYRLNDAAWQGRLFFSPPEIGMPQSGMSDFATVLNRQFPADKYVLWGAVLHLKGAEIVGGCVGHFYNRMRSIFPNQTVIDRPFCRAIDLSQLVW